MKRTALMIFALSALTVGCRTASMQWATASATLEPRSGSNARGTANFSQRSDGSVAMRVDISGVAPGLHGIHVHENGDCSAADATSAGGHFNPNNGPHGGPHDTARHAGDFGNVTADANGTIRTEVVVSGVTLGDGPASAVGKALVLHATADDFTSQPAGNSGARIACGVITLASPVSMQNP